MLLIFITDGDCAIHVRLTLQPYFCASSVLQETNYIILIYAAPLLYITLDVTLHLSRTSFINTYVIQEGFEPRTSVVLLRIYYAETVQLVSYHDGLQSSLG